MRKNKVFVFTDCYIYGGSERLMSFLFRNQQLNENYEIALAYRTHTFYESGIKNDYSFVERQALIALNLLSNETLFHKINCTNLPATVKKIVKVPFFLLEKFLFYKVWNAIIFFFLLKRLKPDLIHVNNGGYPGAKSCNILVWVNRLFYKSKVIYQVNNQAFMPTSLDRYFDNFLNEYVDRFVTASKVAKDRLYEARNFNQNKISVINNCVVPEPVSRSRQEIFDELTIPLNAFVIIEVAFLTGRKGQKYLIEALSKCLQENHALTNELFLLLVGDGEDRKSLESYSSTLGVCKNVFFLGYKSNSQDYIAASDLMVLPSVSNEDMPLVILTGLQLGKPILATNFAGIAEAIQEGVNGILVDSDPCTLADNLADSIMILFNDRDFACRLAKEAKKSFNAYSPEEYGRKMSNLYLEVLNKSNATR